MANAVVDGGGSSSYQETYHRPATEYDTEDKKKTGDGYTIFVMGLFWGIFKGLHYAGYIDFPFIVQFLGGIALWIGSVVIIFKKKGIVFSGLLIASYFAGAYGPFGITTPLIIGTVLFLIVGFAFHRSKENEHEMRDWFEGEIKTGLSMLFLFVLDIGLLYILAGDRVASIPLIGTYAIPLTATAIGMLGFIPWWALLGAFTSPPEAHSAFGRSLISIVRVVVPLYLFFSLIYVSIPGLGRDANIAGISDIGGGIKSGQEKLANKGENPGISQIACTFTNLANPQGIDECVKNRQANSKCEHLKKADVLDYDNEEYQECLRQARGDKLLSEIAGGSDEGAKEATKLELTLEEDFKGKLIGRAQNVPLKLVVQSPRNPVTITGVCGFVGGQTAVPGSLSIGAVGLQVPKQEYIEKAVLCYPQGDLPKGNYRVNVSLVVGGMQTSSRLARAFIMSGMPKDAKESVRSTYFARGEGKSVAPNEPVRVTFAVGDPPSNPLIETASRPILVAALSNQGVSGLGMGEVAAVRSVKIMLPRGLILADEACEFSSRPVEQGAYSSALVRENVKLGRLVKESNVQLGVCTLSIEDELLREMPEIDNPFLYRDNFIATIDYDYRITKEFPVEKVEIEAD